MLSHDRLLRLLDIGHESAAGKGLVKCPTPGDQHQRARESRHQHVRNEVEREVLAHAGRAVNVAFPLPSAYDQDEDDGWHPIGTCQRMILVASLTYVPFVGDMWLPGFRGPLGETVEHPPYMLFIPFGHCHVPRRLTPEAQTSESILGRGPAGDRIFAQALVTRVPFAAERYRSAAGAASVGCVGVFGARDARGPEGAA